MTCKTTFVWWINVINEFQLTGTSVENCIVKEKYCLFLMQNAQIGENLYFFFNISMFPLRFMKTKYVPSNYEVYIVTSSKQTNKQTKRHAI